jgi:hypothetical protein
VELSESLKLIVEAESTELSFVEIRDSRCGHEVVTLLEILSPAIKPGRDREKFLQKRAEVLESHTSLVEIDVLRGEAEVPLDLQYMFQLAYQCGPYWRGAVDYTEPPNPPLLEVCRAWGEERVRAWSAGEWTV